MNCPFCNSKMQRENCEDGLIDANGEPSPDCQQCDGEGWYWICGHTGAKTDHTLSDLLYGAWRPE